VPDPPVRHTRYTDGGTMTPVTNAENGPTATLHTSNGDISVNLFPDQAPKTVANFVGLATGEGQYSEPNAKGSSNGPFYDGTIFHRVIAGFMLQTGDPTGTGRGGPGYKFADEFHPDLRFDRPYLLAMANAGPGTNGSQFFITVAPTTWLNRKHTIFGEVADQTSRDVVDAIAAAATGPGDRPVSDIVIETVEITR
jgi:peptidyl-prolyl cis-trans isomerase A (cyclophilin A)